MKKEITLVLKADTGGIYPLCVTIDYASKKIPADGRIWKWVKTYLEECKSPLADAKPIFILDGYQSGWGFDYSLAFRIEDKVFEL
jgi:hypothetical protein